MIKTVFATAALLLATTSLSFATPQIDDGQVLKVKADVMQVADKGRGGGDNSGSGRGGADDGANHDVNDDRGGAAAAPTARSSSANDVSGSGRSKKRIKGGSGCDDPGDVAEHPECR